MQLYGSFVFCVCTKLIGKLLWIWGAKNYISVHVLILFSPSFSPTAKKERVVREAQSPLIKW